MRSTLRLLPVHLALAALAATGARADVLPATTCAETGPGARTCTLHAKPGAVVLPGLGPVVIWGYAPTAADAASSPGPTLIVNQGDLVTISLENGLAVPTALAVAGQDGPPALAGVAPGGAGAITFTASRAGTFLYEAAPLPGAEVQPAMGLFGVLVVRPAPAPATPQAFEDAASAYDDEVIVVLSELDPALNGAADPSGFDLRAFNPTYGLVNGRPWPDAALIPSGPGRRVLLRYANAGTEPHVMALLGASQTTLAVNGGRTAAPLRVVAQELPPGQTADVIVSVPASAPPGARYALYEGGLSLHNGSEPGLGGMLTFVVAGAGTPPPGAGPVTGAVAVSPSPTSGAAGATVTATVRSAASTVAGAELFVGAPGAEGSGAALAALDGALDEATEEVTLTLPAAGLAALPTGAHAIYVRGRDAGGAWGPVSSAVLLLDHDGPAISAITAAPAFATGAGDVALEVSGDDRATGGAAVVAAEWFLDPAGVPPPGSGNALAAGPAGDVTGFTGFVAAAAVAALPEGAHAVAVRARDALGNWGALRSTPLTVDRTGPGTAAVAVTPAVTDGVQGISSGNPSLRVTATLTDAAGLAAAEGFVDAAGADGAGFPLIPVDGLLDSTTEVVFADIPLSTIVQLDPGPHAVLVHGKDRAGSWGAPASGSFVYDGTAALFADGFESGGLGAWSGGVAGPGLAATAAASLDPAGTRGLAVALSAPGVLYVADGTPALERSYRARFRFDPNSATVAGVTTLFAGVNGWSTPFSVLLRTRGGRYELAIRVLGRAGTATSGWIRIADAPHLVELAWVASSGAGPRLRLWVDGAAALTLSGQDTRAQRVDAVRLGRVAGPKGRNAGSFHFDAFASGRGSAFGRLPRGWAGAKTPVLAP